MIAVELKEFPVSELVGEKLGGRLDLVSEGYWIMLRYLDFILKSPMVKQGSDGILSVCLIIWRGLEGRKAGESKTHK